MSTKVGEYWLKRGTKVEIYGVNKELLGIGKYVCMAKIVTSLPGDSEEITYNTPKFKLKNRIIYGDDCWWIPVSVAKKLKKAHEYENYTKDF